MKVGGKCLSMISIYLLPDLAPAVLSGYTVCLPLAALRHMFAPLLCLRGRVGDA